MRTSKHFCRIVVTLGLMSSPAQPFTTDIRQSLTVRPSCIMAYHDKLLVQGSYAEVPVITGYSAFNFASMG